MASRLSIPRLLVIAVVAALAVAGCSGSKSATSTSGMPEAFPNHSAQQIHRLIEGQTDTLSAFQARARMTVRSPRRSGTFNAEVRQSRNDSLWMRMSRFGFEGARVLVTRDSFFVHNRMENQMMVGTVDEAQSLLAAPVTAEEAFSNMLGLISPSPSVNWNVGADSLNYYLTSPSGRTTYTIDPVNWRVIRYARMSDDGDILEERMFGNFKTIDGVPIPQQVVFRNRPEKAMAMLTYESMHLDPENLSFDFNVPAGTPRVYLPTSSR
ncbi:DUF4292 domain-containing protein [Longibacter salinarum]|nr:DUF4292 domain-containing protein [Longibacter salinarum]